MSASAAWPPSSRGAPPAPIRTRSASSSPSSRPNSPGSGINWNRSVLRLDLREPVLDREGDQLRGALQVELAKDVAAVGLHRAGRQVEPLADLIVAQALPDQRQDRALPVR